MGFCLGKSELATIGFSEIPRWEDLLGDQGSLVVHHCCAAWSDGVLQDDNYEFQNLDKAVYTGSKQKCDFCNRYGASICCRATKCCKFYHYPCAAAAGTLQIFSSMSLLCVDHLTQAKPSEVICNVCKTMGDPQDQMFCTICGNHYHSKCLQNSITPSPELRAGWQCPDCKQCQICGTANNGNKMLVCDSCDKGFHSYCLRPMITTLPKQSWKCASCRLCEDCGLTVPGSSQSSRWHLNFTLCDVCFIQRSKGDFCPVCCKAHGSYIEVAMLACSLCQRAVHAECEANTELLIQNCRSNYLCPYCRGEVTLSDVMMTKDQRELIKGVSKPNLDLECNQSNNSDDNSSGLSTPTEMSVKSDDSSIFTGKPEIVETTHHYPMQLGPKPLQNSFLPIPHSGGKKKTKPVVGYSNDKGRQKKKNCMSGNNKRNICRMANSGFLDSAALREEEEDPSNYCAVVIYNSQDKFVADQDLCYSCGSFGLSTEGKMIACAQCGQAYHIYCTNLNLSKEGLRKVIESGWRCLDCTVCNSCGNANDEAQLLLCDDCDISYHTYCLEPPLDTVPVGGWKCKWCVHCVKCSSGSPGVNCNWLSNYTECGPCHSTSTCPVCNQGYVEEDLLASCGTCRRWLHARCDNMQNENEVEFVVSKSYQCILCRPKVRSIGAENGAFEREYLFDGTPLTESGAHHINSLSNFNMHARRKSSRRSQSVLAKSRNKNFRSSSEKLHLDDSDGEMTSDNESTTSDVSASKRPSKLKGGNVGSSFLPKPGKPGKLSKSKIGDSRNEPTPIYDVNQVALESESGNKSTYQECFFGKHLIEVVKKDEKGAANVSVDTATLCEDGRTEKPSNDDLLLHEDDLNLPVVDDDFMNDIFLSNDNDQFSALAEDINMALQTAGGILNPQVTNQRHPVDPGTLLSNVDFLQNSGDTNSGKHCRPINITTAVPSDPKTQQQVMAQPQQQQTQHQSTNQLSLNCNDVAMVNPPVANNQNVNSLDHVEIPPRPADTPQHHFGYPSASTVVQAMNVPVPSQQAQQQQPQQTMPQVTNHSNAVIDVDGLLTCPGAGLNFDSLPQIDSQDVDDILTTMEDMTPQRSGVADSDDSLHSQQQQAIVDTNMRNRAYPQQTQQVSNPHQVELNDGFTGFSNNAWAQMNVNKVIPSGSNSLNNQRHLPNTLSETSSEQLDSDESKNYKRYEADEVLGDQARIAAVLYANKKHPNLKYEYPENVARMKQIHKLWRKASQEDRTQISMLAKENRARNSKANKKGKKSPSNNASNKEPAKTGSTTASVNSKTPPHTNNLDQPPQHVEMVQQLAHQQQFIEQHIQQTSSLSNFPALTNSQMPEMDRSLQNFTPSKNYSPGSVSAVNYDERSQRSAVGLLVDGSSLSDTESTKQRQSVPSADAFNNSPMTDGTGAGSFSQQHSPALSQSSMPKSSPLMQSPQMPVPQPQRQLSYDSCKVNATCSTAIPVPDNSISPVAQATSIGSTNASAMSPHAVVYRQQIQMQPMRPAYTQYYAVTQSSTAYGMPPAGNAPQFYYQTTTMPRHYRAATWANPEMIPSGQWATNQMHYNPRRPMIMRPHNMFQHYRSPGPSLNHGSYPPPHAQMGVPWTMQARPVAATGHYPEMFPQGAGHSMRIPPQHFPSGAAVSYQRPTSSTNMPSSSSLKSPSAIVHSTTPPKDKGMMSSGSAVVNQVVAIDSKTKPLPILSESDTIEIDFFQPPSVQNETGFDRYAEELETPDLTFGRSRSVESNQQPSSNECAPSTSSYRPSSSAGAASVYEFFDIEETSPKPCGSLMDVKYEDVDVEQLEASFMEAVKERPTGSTAPLVMAGQTLNSAAALAVADVVGQLSANYQAQENDASCSESSVSITAQGRHSQSQQQISSQPPVKAVKTSSFSETKPLQSHRDDHSQFKMSMNQAIGINVDSSANSRLVSEQPLLIQDLLEQERFEQANNVVSSSSQSSSSSHRGGSSVIPVSAHHAPKTAPQVGVTSPSFPHSEMLQRISNRHNQGPLFSPVGASTNMPPQSPQAMMHVFNPSGSVNPRYNNIQVFPAAVPTSVQKPIGDLAPQLSSRFNPGSYGISPNSAGGAAASNVILAEGGKISSITTSNQTSPDQLQLAFFSNQTLETASATSCAPGPDSLQGDLINSKLKKAEEELDKMRKSKKGLLSKQRTAKKNNSSISDVDKESLEQFTKDISAKVKECECLKKKLKLIASENAVENIPMSQKNSRVEIPTSQTVDHLVIHSAPVQQLRGPPRHPNPSIITSNCQQPKVLQSSANSTGSPRLKRPSVSLETITHQNSSELNHALAKTELIPGINRNAAESFALTSNENSNHSSLYDTDTQHTGNTEIQANSFSSEPATKKRKLKSQDDSSVFSICSNADMLMNSNQVQFTEAFVDPVPTSTDESLNQDLLLNSIKQLPELKPQEPDLKIDWTLISPKLPWSCDPLGNSVLSGEFGKGILQDRKDYYAAFLCGDVLPSSSPPSRSRSRSPSPGKDQSGKCKLDDDKEDSVDGCSRKLCSTIGARKPYDSISASSPCGSHLDENSAKIIDLKHLNDLDIAGRRPTETLSPCLEMDPCSSNLRKQLDMHDEPLDCMTASNSIEGENFAINRWKRDEILHKRSLAPEQLEIALEIHNAVGHHPELPMFLKKLSQMLCIGPLEDCSVRSFSRDPSISNTSGGVCLIGGSELQVYSEISSLSPNSCTLASNSSRILLKRSPSGTFLSSAGRACCSCRSILGSSFITKRLTEFIPQESDDPLHFCNNDCFLQFALQAKRKTNFMEIFKRRRSDLGDTMFSDLMSDGFGSDIRNENGNLKPNSDGISNALKTANRWENIRWKRFRRNLQSQTSTPNAVRSNSATSLSASVAGEENKENSLVRLDNSHLMNASLNEEIVQMIDGLDVCVALDHSKDTRVCIFCGQQGDGKSNGPARLLNYDCDKWVHLNCALWSEEVYETTNGALINVQAAFLRSMEQECSYCGMYGATVACHKSKCTLEYHFPCSLNVGCMFFIDKTVLCPQHRYRNKTDSELVNFEVFRRVYIHRDDHEIIAKVVEQPERMYTFRCGSLQLESIGQLFLHQMNSFHNQNAIYPVGYQTTRFYWSIYDANKRCKYFCSIQDHEGKPQFLIECPKPSLSTGQQSNSEELPAILASESETLETSAEFFKGESSKETWKTVMTNVNKLRNSPNSLKLFPEACSGDEMFGLQDVQIVKILESFPGIEACKFYNFKFGRSPLVHLPLAINPSGCCRSEPKMRSYIKRPHVLTSGSGKGSGGRSSIASLACGDSTTETVTPYSKQFVHTKSSQYKRMKQEWRNLCHLGRSLIQGLGMYASRDVEKGTMIIEYIGLLIRSEVAEVREKQYDRMNLGIYMFRLDDDWVIDATVHGGPARFINHSCDPNCQAELVVFDKSSERKEKRIIITSVRRIASGEELTYDYKIDFENDDKIPCNCGSSSCRKWMN